MGRDRTKAANAATVGVWATVAPAMLGCAMEVSRPAEPPPTNYRQVIAEHVRKSYFDPYTVRDAGIAVPRPGWAYASDMSGQHKAGWAICVRSNAKNRMGAYTGLKDNIYVIQDGQVVASGQDLHTSEARKGCEDAKYEPFPEIEKPVR